MVLNFISIPKFQKFSEEEAWNGSSMRQHPLLWCARSVPLYPYFYRVWASSKVRI